MLDLSTINSFYELKWFDGEIIHLPKPPEKLFREIAALDASGMTDLEQMDEIKRLVWEILKKNDDGRKFTKAELEQCDGLVCSMIIRDYMDEAYKRLGE